jgi:hypothetical protein
MSEIHNVTGSEPFRVTGGGNSRTLHGQDDCHVKEDGDPE